MPKMRWSPNLRRLEPYTGQPEGQGSPGDPDMPEKSSLYKGWLNRFKMPDDKPDPALAGDKPAPGPVPPDP